MPWSRKMIDRANSLAENVTITSGSCLARSEVFGEFESQLADDRRRRKQKEEAVDDLLSKEERGRSSIRPTL